MSGYLALARKHRPQTFEDIVGQEHVCKTLQKAIEGQRIHHAYLFAGIRGIGKTTCARVLAKALNCKEGPTPHPCNTCVSCIEITAGRSMDVMELDAASNRGIDDIRELREGVRYTTARDRFKVVIIDEVHMLTEQAFNALLKTLEEPPAHVRFILATTDPQKLPATILSRCQRFDFRRVSTAGLVAHLARICKKEDVEVEEDALAIVVRQTQGSVRDSMSLLDQLIAASQGRVTAQFAKEVLGVADRRWVLDCLSALLSGDARKALLVLREVFVSGYDVFLFISEVLQNLRHAMVLAVSGKNKELVDLSQSELNELVEIIKGRNPLDLHYYLQVMLQAVEQIRRSEFPLFAAEEALVRVASASQTAQVGHLVQRLVDLEQRIAKAAVEPDLFRSGGGGQTPPTQRPADQGTERPAEPTSTKTAEPTSTKTAGPTSTKTAEPITSIKPAEPSTVAKAAEPAAQLIEADTRPIEPEAMPVEPATQLIEADTRPIEPEAMPVEPATQLIEADTRPIEPEAMPVEPATPLIEADTRPIEPATIAEEEDSDDTDSVDEPMKVVQLEMETPNGAPLAEGEAGSHDPDASNGAVLEDVESVKLPEAPAELPRFWEGFVCHFKAQRKDERVGQFETTALEMLVLKSIEDSGRRFVVKGPSGTRHLALSLDLETSLLKYLGFAVKVDFIEAEEDTPDSIASNRKRQRRDQKAKREKELRELPLVKDILDIFQGRISGVQVQERD